ncbi:MAG: cysteine desulfurase NifS [Acetatifactor sp.]|nr:cysteine desulfurase NifS [Acetatifactor sp.]
MIYLDNAATTRMAPEVLDAMLPFFADNYGNPSTIYGLGAKARRAVAEAREHVSALMGAKPEEIYFTSGGTEADNWAIKAVAEAYTDKGKHIITTKIEHHAVLHTCKWLERQGFEVTYLDVDKDGLVHVEDVREALRPDTILISVMFANNEIGTIEPIAEIGALAHEHNILFHTDAVQAFGQIPVDVKAMNVDLLSASAHKVNGPKGVGCLYIRSDVKIRSFLHGGAQERSRRAGTENVPGIVGFGEAARRAARILPEKQKREQSLRDYLIDRLESEVPWCRLNGHRSRRLPGNVNFSFSFVEGESLLIRLDMEGICVSSGSACTSGSLDPSHVLLAIGLKHEEAHGSLRFTLSEENTKEELDTVVEAVKKTVDLLRQMSPLYEDFLKNNKSERPEELLDKEA